VPVNYDGVPCFCGGRGCLAAYASGRGIAERARDRVAGHAGAPMLRLAGGDPATVTAPLVFEAAAAGDADARLIVDEACRALGAIVAVIVNGLNPEVIVVTGGVAASFVPLENAVLRYAGEYAFARALAATTVRIVPADKRLTMRGAAALVLYETDRRSRDSGVDSRLRG
jgi:glucokinase